MGIVARQSSIAVIAIAIGLVFGTLNTMYVLPRAFEGDEELWGLVRVVTSWSIIITQVCVLGAPNAIMRFLSRYPEVERPGILKTLLTIPLLGVAIACIALLFGKNGMLILVDVENRALVTQHMDSVILLVIIMSALQIVRAIVSEQLQTGISAWVDEAWLKGSYFALALLLLFDLISFGTFFGAYIGTWAIGALLLLAKVSRLPQRLHGSIRWDAFPEILRYSMYSLLSGGAAVIAINLDFVMLGKYMGLATVPVYTIGFFLGTVVGMPLRATQKILTSITAHKVHGEQQQELRGLNTQSGRVNLILSGAVMAGIWAGFQPFEMLLPEGYRGVLVGVFLSIAVQRIILGTMAVNNAILGFSEYYRIALPINLGLLAVTVASNYAFIVIFDWGITGAALATLGTAIWNNAWRSWFIWKNFKTHPFSWSWVPIMAIAISAGFAFHWPPEVCGPPVIGALAQGTLAAGSTLLIAYSMGFFPELRDDLRQRISWWP